MLGKYIKFDGVQFPNPNPGSFAPAFNPQENIFLTESGKQASNIVRLDRFSFDAKFNCTSVMRDKFIALCQQDETVCEVDGVEYTGRLRLSGAYTLVENTERVEGTNGLWLVSVRFEGQ